MLKILLILLLAYLVYRAGKNLLLAAVGDRSHSGQDSDPPHVGRQEDGRRQADIEDAVWEDIP